MEQSINLEIVIILGIFFASSLPRNFDVVGIENIFYTKLSLFCWNTWRNEKIFIFSWVSFFCQTKCILNHSWGINYHQIDRKLGSNKKSLDFYLCYYALGNKIIPVLIMAYCICLNLWWWGCNYFFIQFHWNNSHTASDVCVSCHTKMVKCIQPIKFDSYIRNQMKNDKSNLIAPCICTCHTWEVFYFFFFF